MVTIDEHTFDETLLNENSKVLDVGCRGFNFALWIRQNTGAKVTAIDADPAIVDPLIKGVEYLNRAVVSDITGAVDYYSFGNGTASYIETCGGKPSECEVFHVKTYKIEPFWDLIKLDCEGAEYDILMNMDRPIAKQISVEFHEHTQAAKGDDYMQKLFARLSVDYHIGNLIKETRHGCIANYWDVLLTLK